MVTKGCLGILGVVNGKLDLCFTNSWLECHISECLSQCANMHPREILSWRHAKVNSRVMAHSFLPAQYCTCQQLLLGGSRSKTSCNQKVNAWQAHLVLNKFSQLETTLTKEKRTWIPSKPEALSQVLLSLNRSYLRDRNKEGEALRPSSSKFWVGDGDGFGWRKQKGSKSIILFYFCLSDLAHVLNSLILIKQDCSHMSLFCNFRISSLFYF